MIETATIQFHTVMDFSPWIGNGEIRAVNAGPFSELYYDLYLLVHDSGKYRVLEWSKGELTLDVWIENELFDIHDVQPLPTGEILLVCGRSSYRGKDDFDRNGRIYSREGQFVREILLGDGIQNVQATSDGKIWTGFYDEGVFGNLGWHDPVGKSGLVAWNPLGEKLYEFQPTGELDTICDCYALNSASNSTTWAYYYTEFSLVQIRDFKIVAHWEIPLAGSSSFAIDKNGIALFSGGYDDHDLYHFFELGAEGKVKERAQIRMVDTDDNPIKRLRTFGRSDSLFVVDETRLFQIVVGFVPMERTIA